MTKVNQDLQKKLDHYKNLLKSKQAETDNLQQRFKVLTSCGSVRCIALEQHKRAVQSWPCSVRMAKTKFHFHANMLH